MTARHLVEGRLGCDAVVITAVSAACQSSDHRALRKVLAENVTAIVDGGGAALAPTASLWGTAEVAGYLLGLVTNHPEAVLSERQVNGRAAIALASGGRVMGIVSLGTRSGLVEELFIVVNPDKLRAWNPE